MLCGVHSFPHLHPELSCTTHLSKPLLSAITKVSPAAAQGAQTEWGAGTQGSLRSPAPAPSLFSWAAAGLGVHRGTGEMGGTCHSPKQGAHLQLLINKQQQRETSSSGKQGEVLLPRPPAQCALSSKGGERRAPSTRAAAAKCPLAQALPPGGLCWGGTSLNQVPGCTYRDSRIRR